MEPTSKPILTRRWFLRSGLASLSGYHLLPMLRPLNVRAEGRLNLKGTAEYCIFVFLNGGASQLDTFDLREGRWTPQDYEVRALRPGILWPFGQFPRLAANIDRIAIAVVVTAIKKQLSKKSGNEFARLGVEDFSGAAEVLVFPEAWAAIGDRVQADVPVLIKGGYSRRDQGTDAATFIVESVTRLAELRTTGQLAVSIELAADTSLPTAVMTDVRAVVDAHPGAAPIEVRWSGGDGSRATLRSASLKLSPASAALLELRALLGTDRVRLVRGS